MQNSTNNTSETKTAGSFNYTYSSTEQEELRRLREKYTAPEESKLDKVRRMDAAVTKKATTCALVLGILGALILGLGMSLAMTDIGDALGSFAMPVGIIIGVVGLILAVTAYPVFTFVTKTERKRIAPEILDLTDELMK